MVHMNNPESEVHPIIYGIFSIYGTTLQPRQFFQVLILGLHENK